MNTDPAELPRSIEVNDFQLTLCILLEVRVSANDVACLSQATRYDLILIQYTEQREERHVLDAEVDR